jgi:hypothetical protein
MEAFLRKRSGMYVAATVGIGALALCGGLTQGFTIQGGKGTGKLKGTKPIAKYQHIIMW